MKARFKELRRSLQPALTCTGQVGTVQMVMDPDTLEMVETFVPAWTGACLVYPLGMNAYDVTVGEQEHTISRYSVILPAGVPAEIGQRFQVTESRDEPGLVGLPFALVDVPLSAWPVAQQCVAALVDTP